MNFKLYFVLLISFLILVGTVSAATYTVNVYKTANSTTLTLDFNGTKTDFNIAEAYNQSNVFTFTVGDTIIGGTCDINFLNQIDGIVDTDLADLQAWFQQTYTNYTSYKSDYENCNQTLLFTYNDLETCEDKRDNMNQTLSSCQDEKDTNSTLMLVFAIISVFLFIALIFLVLYSQGYVGWAKEELDARKRRV